MTAVRLMRAYPVSRVLCFGLRSKKPCSVITLLKSFLKNIPRTRKRHRLRFILCWYIKLWLQMMATGQSAQTQGWFQHQRLSESQMVGKEVCGCLGRKRMWCFTKTQKNIGNFHSDKEEVCLYSFHSAKCVLHCR